MQRDTEDQDPIVLAGPEKLGGVVARRPGDEEIQVTQPENKGQEPRIDKEAEEVLVAGPNAYGFVFDSMKTMVTYIYNLFDNLRTLFKELDG